jgi:hypothetical protein
LGDEQTTLMQTQFTLTIPASGVANFHRAGKVFAVISATAAFKLRPEQGANLDMNVGRGFGDPAGQEWNYLTFQNTSGAGIDVTFYWGFEDYRPDPAQFAGSFVTTATQANQPTYTTGSGVVNLVGSGTTGNFTGVNGADRRKQIVIANLNKPPADASVTAPDVLYVKSSDGLVCGVIFPQTSWTVESGGLFTVNNPGATAIDYAIGEVWYDF